MPVGSARDVFCLCCGIRQQPLKQGLGRTKVTVITRGHANTRYGPSDPALQPRAREASLSQPVEGNFNHAAKEKKLSDRKTSAHKGALVDMWPTRFSFNKAAISATGRLLQISKHLREHRLLGYGAAFLIIGVATTVEWLTYDEYRGTFSTAYPLISVAALIGGIGPGFLSAILAGISRWGLFSPHFHWFSGASYAFDAILCVMLIALVNRTLDGLLADIEQEKQAGHCQHLLAMELHHRIQNIFAVMQAVIHFSLTGEGPIQKSVIKQRLMSRLQSMSAANRSITDSMESGVCLMDLINSEICGLESRFDIRPRSGLMLAPQMTQNLALILHELVTNALKYGALSVAHGRVKLQLDWTSSVLTVHWQEHHGLPAMPPSTSGFGGYILGNFARTFCQEVDACHADGGFSYRVRIHSDQLRCLDANTPDRAEPNLHAAGDSPTFSEPRA
jgi:two-component sensor histidine kinase